MAAFRYELPSQGLLHKRPIIHRGEYIDFSRFEFMIVYDSYMLVQLGLVYAGMKTHDSLLFNHYEFGLSFSEGRRSF